MLTSRECVRFHGTTKGRKLRLELFGGAMPPKSRGQHRSRDNLVKVCLRDSVYSSWKEKQDHRGFGNNIKNDFAGCLLHCNRLSSSSDVYRFLGAGIPGPIFSNRTRIRTRTPLILFGHELKSDPNCSRVRFITGGMAKVGPGISETDKHPDSTWFVFMSGKQ